MKKSAFVKIPKSSLRTLPAILTVALGFAAAVQAGTLYWDGLGAAAGTSTNWGNIANWSTVPGAATPAPANPPGAGDDVIFNITPATTLSFINLNADQSVHSMTFNSSGGVQMVNNATNSGTVSRNLNLGAGGITVNPGAGAVSLNVSNATYGQMNVAIGASQTWLNNSANALSMIGSNQPGVITCTISSGQTLKFAGPGSFQFGIGSPQTWPNLTGAGAIAKSGSGKLMLFCSNTFAGGTILNGGTLQLNTAWALGTGPLTINGGFLDGSASIATTNAQYWNGDFGSISGLIFNFGSVTLGGNRQVTVNANTLQFFGGIGDSGSGYGLTKLGNGTLQLNGSNTFSGAMVVGGGTLTLAAGRGGSLNGATVTPLTFNGTATWNYDNTGAGSANKSQNMGALTFASGDATVQINHANGTQGITNSFSSMAARSTGATRNFTIGGVGGTMGVNTYLNLGGTSAGFLDQGSFVNGNDYAWMNAAGTYPRPITYGTDPGSATSAATTSLASTLYQKITGSISAQTDATFTTLNMSGNVNMTNASGATVTVNGILKPSGTSVITGGNGIQAASGAEMVVYVPSGTLTINTPILDNGANALTKAGTGKLFLSAAGNHTGNTYINAGALLLTNSGSLNSSPNIIIANGATFDVSGLGAFTTYTFVSPLTASGSGGAPALIKGASGGNVDLQSQPITLNYDGAATPALGVTQGTLNLNANNFIINNAGGYLPNGSYTVVTNATPITDNWLGAYPAPTGTAIDPSKTATISISGNNVVLAIKSAPTFSGLTASQSIAYGTSAITLSGKVSASGAMYPAQNEYVNVTINGNMQSAQINDATGDFSFSYNPSTIPVSGAPYTISYSYAGNAQLNSTSDASTTLTVTNSPPMANNATYTRNAGVYQLNIPVSDLLSHASDPDGDTLTLASVGTSTNGVTPTINSGNVVYYNPNNVADQFSYTVSDGHGNTASANVIVNLNTSSVFGQASPSVDTTGGAPNLTFAGIPGYSYSIQRADDLGFTVNVTTILTTNAPSGGVFHFTDNTAPSPQAFYRLQWNP